MALVKEREARERMSGQKPLNVLRPEHDVQFYWTANRRLVLYFIIIALAESFFGIVKTELLYRQSFETAEEFVASLKEYIHYYNNKRIKNRLNEKSPVEYRALAKT